jgi:hypothetical protein
MSKQSSIPVKDADFNVAQGIIVTMANNNRNQWGLDGQWMDSDLLSKKTAWAAYENPATRNPTITSAKNEKRTAYEKSLRILVKNLQSNTRVTDDNLRAMGIVVPSTTHTPFTLEFDENERGKTIYFCLCGENTRGEKGPWSEIQNAIIP